MPELTEAQRSFLDQYAKNGGIFGKKKARKKNAAMVAEYQRFNVNRDAVREKVMKVTDEGLKNRLLGELDEAENLLGIDEDAPNFKAGHRHLVYIGQELTKPQGNGKDQAPPHSDKERKNFAKDNRKKPIMERENERAIQVEGAIPGTKKAIQNLETAIEDLRKQRAAAKTPAEMSELVDAYAEKKAQVTRLQSLLSQYENFGATQATRIDMLIDAENRLEQGQKEANTLAAAIKKNPSANIDSLNEIVDAAYFVSDEGIEGAEKRNKSLSDMVKFSANRIVRADQVFPGEPEITEISEDQADVLGKLLDSARDLIASLKEQKKPRQDEVERLLKYATVLHDKVRDDLSFFRAKRVTGLPLPSDPPTDRFDVLSRMLARLEQRLVDIFGLGSRHRHKRLSKTADKLRADLLAVDPKDPKNFDAVDKALNALEADVDGVLEDLQKKKPSTDRKKVNEAAGNVANSVAQKMLSLYRTEPIKDASKIEKPGEPYKEGMIPYDQVLEITDDKGKVTYHRIKVKKQKGEYVTERKDKGVPRAIMDLMKGRADTLAMMTASMADGCEDAISAYADETKEMLKNYTSKDAMKNFKKTEELLVKIENKDLKDKLILEYVPDRYGLVRQEWEDFKTRQPTMAPGDALKEAEGFKDTIEVLKETAKDTKTEHKKNHELSYAMFAQLAVGEFDIDAGTDALGAQMEALFAGGALKKAKERAAARPESETRQDTVRDIEVAMASMKLMKAKPSDMQGPWRRQVLQARKLNNMKSEGAVGEATKIIESVEKGIVKFKARLAASASGNLNDKEIGKLLRSIAKRMLEGAEGAMDHRDEVAAYEGHKKNIGELLKQIGKKSEGKANKKDLDDRRKASKSQYEAITGEAKKNLDYTYANAELEKLTKDLEGLKDLAESDGKAKKEKPSEIKVLPRAENLAEALKSLNTAAAELIDKRARPKVSDEQKKTYAKLKSHLDKAEKSLKLVANVADASDLVKIADDIDKAKAEDGKKKKLERREKALSLLHRVRSQIDTHPAVKLYHENPFDRGAHFSMLRNYLHYVEIGILASVDPRE